MRKTNLLVGLTIVLLSATLMNAQATRTWVSGVGDDANPCSRTAPCKTFAGAISKTAPSGEIDALDPGGFGALTITKAITLDGGGGQVASVLVSGTNAIVVQAQANDIVTIRNLRLDGLGTGINGIRWLSGKALHIENCIIFGFTNNGVDIAKSDGGQAYIVGTISQDNTQSGVRATDSVNTVSVTIDNSQFENNGFVGVFASDFSRFSVSKSESAGNQFGYVAQSGTGNAILDVFDSTAAFNSSAGIQAGGGATAATVNMANTALFDNGTNLVVGVNGTVNSFKNNYNNGAGAPSTTTNPQ